MNSNSKKGFTLIELLIVIAIIGILASVVLVSLSSAREKAKVASFKAQAHSIQAAAVIACDSLAAGTTLDTALGTIPAGITIAASGTPSCGASGTGTFTLTGTSTLLASQCTATITDTGITSFSGC